MMLTPHNPVVITFLEALKLKSAALFDHSVHVGNLAREIGETIGLSDSLKSELQIAGLLHDIGKIAIRDDILKKPSLLNDAEWEHMKMHPVLGSDALQPFPEMSNIAKIILCHHERIDGLGYPYGLKNGSIPFGSKIIHICDAFVAMVNERTYKPRYPREYAARMALSLAYADNNIDRAMLKSIEQKLLTYEHGGQCELKHD